MRDKLVQDISRRAEIHPSLAQVSYGDAAALRAFLEEYPEASGGLLLLGEKIVALPWTRATG